MHFLLFLAQFELFYLDFKPFLSIFSVFDKRFAFGGSEAADESYADNPVVRVQFYCVVGSAVP